MEIDPVIDQELSTWLKYYGVDTSFEIENEAKVAILNALRQEDVSRVYIDDEGGLMIEFREDNE